MRGLSRRAVLIGGLVGCGGRGVEAGRLTTEAPPGHAPADPSPPAATSEPGPGFALVELFSSEGCSSCPPADAVLARLAADARPRVIALAFHVDYWDELGWPDPFASPAFTERQQRYSQGLGLRGLYTPQMVVNGRREFTGSDHARATAAVEEALASPSKARLSLGPIEATAGGRRLPFTLEGGRGARVFAAVVEDGLTTEVKRGENAGRRLRHEAVVRGLTSVEASPSGNLSIAARGRVVAWVQRPGGEVLDARRLDG